MHCTRAYAYTDLTKVAIYGLNGILTIADAHVSWSTRISTERQLTVARSSFQELSFGAPI